jgi:formylglycine-generating enzyme required for sulfatase activity
MGSEESERGRRHVEGPVHTVHLTRGFYMGSTEVTQAQYEFVMGVNPSFFHGGKYGIDLRRPVEMVNVEDVEEFCRRLSDLEGRPYRLPTEAEWEYACRAGTRTRFFFGDALECFDACEPCPQADPYLWWCGNNSPSGTKPVAQKASNPWCLYDMSGGVWEWCLDWSARYTADEAWDPRGPSTGSERVMRGGYWGFDLDATRSAMRGDLSTEHRYEFLGFRVVLEIEEGEPR